MLSIIANSYSYQSFVWQSSLSISLHNVRDQSSLFALRRWRRILGDHMIFRGRRVLTEYTTAYKSTLEYIRVYNRVDNGVITEYEGGTMRN